MSLLRLVVASAIIACIATGNINPWRFSLRRLIYDDSYITRHLDRRYSYLKQEDGGYSSPRDYHRFDHIFNPTEEYLNGTNLERHIYEELIAFEYGASIATMDQWHYSDADRESNPYADGNSCKYQLDTILSKLQDERKLLDNGAANMHLLRRIDSWGRPPSGTYLGNAYWTGSYQGCIRQDSEGIENTFHYCLAKIRARDWPDEQQDVTVPKISIRVGICLAKACDSKLAMQNGDTVMKIMRFNFSPHHRDRFNKLIGIYCLPNQSASQSMGFIAFWCLMASWLSLIAVASLIRPQKDGILRRISIQNNLKSLIADDEFDSSKSGVDLRSTNVIRFFATISICVAHTFLAIGWTQTSTSIMLDYIKVPFYHIIISFLKSLDVLFVLGGLLSSYTLMIKLPGDKINSLMNISNYLSLQMMKFLRSGPLAIILISFMKSSYIYLGDGPFWDYGTYEYSLQGQCQRSSWWRAFIWPIIFDTQGNSHLNECLLVSWFLVSYTKVFLFAPIIICLMSKIKSGSGKLLLVLMIVALSTLSQYKDLSMQQLVYFRQFLTYNLLFASNILSVRFREVGYYNPFNRLHAFAIGLYAGYLLHEYSKMRRKSWPFWMKGLFFYLMIAYQVYDFFTPLETQNNYLQTKQVPSEEIIKLAMLLKPRIDAIIFATITLRLVSDLAPTIMRYMMPIYKLGKISYGMLLIHPIVISYTFSASEFGRPDTHISQLAMYYIYIITASYALAFPVYILLESPISGLVNLFAKTRINF